MSACQLRSALCSTAPLFLRFAARSATRCPECLRIVSPATRAPAPKRRLQTAAAHRPLSLNPESPPRNLGVPESSIAGGTPGDESRTEWPAPAKPRSGETELPRHEGAKQTSISEGAAQTNMLAAPAAPKPPLKPRRYTFGPRKATIKLSSAAVARLRDLLEQPEPKLIRIGTKAKGCSGLAYHLEYVDAPSRLDEQVEQDGVKVLIDNRALLNIIGSEMDWLEDKLNQRFVFKNPNISALVQRMHAMALANVEQRSNAVAASLSACLESPLDLFLWLLHGTRRSGRRLHLEVCLRFILGPSVYCHRLDPQRMHAQSGGSHHRNGTTKCTETSPQADYETIQSHSWCW